AEVREEDHSRRDCTHKLFRIESVVLFTISVDNTHISPEVVSGLINARHHAESLLSVSALLNKSNFQKMGGSDHCHRFRIGFLWQ
ncbi:hypothetical protein ONJ45_26395, partial [Salmonella enterica subsp. enterica serovar Virginia]|nr:hypothetical protein [Salmonella enterica subsp. enterica serovar Virginia]